MLTHLARLAKERGCGRLEWSVLDWNRPAIGSMRASAPHRWTVYRATGDELEELIRRQPDTG